ncbi:MULTISPECIES: DUF305 domain-containing protein [Catenuloplanes]|uniref:Uncharacterized protein (DUF305 family) n=1 Tax=Catenuloplanes niger TaxID=587534 RepID=A0AAE3ZMH7_9ACTN|nr:DUF305 domain-containing protein [Catenuloplanes niger]MDR7322653.1 uncharacterized protein (DUF305 family) [Catenuloplanes niger]
MLRRALLAGVAVGTTVVLAACGGGDGADGMDHGAGTTTATTPPATATTPSAAASAGTGSNAADVSFAQMMIEHHRQAVEMAELAGTRAGNAEVKALAEKIIAAQQPEIETMSGWLTAWGAAVPEPSMTGMDMGGMDHGSSMPGAMSAQDMAGLAAASGGEFDKQFLTLMIAHHEGAITMAQQETSQGASTEAKALAAKIVTDQQAEIVTMRELLTKL